MWPTQAVSGIAAETPSHRHGLLCTLFSVSYNSRSKYFGEENLCTCTTVCLITLRTWCFLGKQTGPRIISGVLLW